MILPNDEIRSEINRMIADSDCHRKSREYCRDFFLSTREHLPLLINTAFNINHKFHYKACWILELVVEREPQIIYQYVDKLCNIIDHYRHDGALRSISRICMILSLKNSVLMKSGEAIFTEKDRGKIAETCFLWLVGDEKVATKAYAMRTLFELGKYDSAIYPELKDAIEHGYSTHSAAYKAASKDILRKIAKAQK